MAKKLERFPTELTSRALSIYPWDEWFDGDVWELVFGEDFTIKTKSMRTNAQSVARKRGGRLKTGETKEGNLILQFIPPRQTTQDDDEELVDLDTLPPPPPRPRVDDGGRAASIRAWAQGTPEFSGLSDHGRLPREVIDAYERAQRGNVRPFSR